MTVQDTKRPSRTQEERRALAEAKLLDATMSLVADRGIDGVTLADVGEAAGFSRGLPAHHFGTKFGLLKAVGRETGRRVLEDLFPESADEVGLAAVISAIRAFLMPADPRLIRVYLEFQKAAAALNSPYREPLRAFVQSAQDAFEKRIREGQARGEIRADQNSGDLAELTLAVLRGLVLQQIMTDQPVDAARVSASLEASILRGFGALN